MSKKLKLTNLSETEMKKVSGENRLPVHIVTLKTFDIRK